MVEGGQRGWRQREVPVFVRIVGILRSAGGGWEPWKAAERGVEEGGGRWPERTAEGGQGG